MWRRASQLTMLYMNTTLNMHIVAARTADVTRRRRASR
jgi:hypothetical protein